MHSGFDTIVSRRAVMGAALAVTAGAMASPASATVTLTTGMGQTANPVRPVLLRRALEALHEHGHRIPHRDRIAIADFTAPSSRQRFHFVDLANGRTTSLLVAHGSGSDPEHTGWLQQFSNQPGSNASSSGAFVTSDYYSGKHGRSQRLIGLDRTNDNALSRAIVIHGAWYAAPEMIEKHGMLGRSQGCFAVGEQSLDEVFARLGEGRLLYADKLESA
ncbi:MAG TPA: murein L,D-transpeptidase catalytic domain family protein [Sphingomonadaceae bacterium]|nr:murein L,D-transpeptidase catalytic domain family protein [Sphingomonadaceae bacterium]